jgi:hypothetical protein
MRKKYGFPSTSSCPPRCSATRPRGPVPGSVTGGRGSFAGTPGAPLPPAGLIGPMSRSSTQISAVPGPVYTFRMSRSMYAPSVFTARPICVWTTGRSLPIRSGISVRVSFCHPWVLL